MASPVKKQKLNDNSALSKLKQYTVVVADTGNFQELDLYKPQDATTNPSLILQAVNIPDYQQLIQNSIKYGIEKYQQSSTKPKRSPSKPSKKGKQAQEQKEKETKKFIFENLNETERKKLIELICDKISVNFGVELSKKVPGFVSTEVDARLSFDKDATLQKAKKIIQLYEEAGVKKDRILIKIASTWEAQVHLISPFVGRILDYYKKANPNTNYDKEKHPGIISVKEIYQYYKKFGYKTIIMGASFRSLEEILELAGCDRMTISPKFLDELQNKTDLNVPKVLNEKSCKDLSIEKVHMDEKSFRWNLNQDAMATEKLSEGIRKFAEDIVKLENLIENKLKDWKEI